MISVLACKFVIFTKLIKAIIRWRSCKKHFTRSAKYHFLELEEQDESSYLCLVKAVHSYAFILFLSSLVPRRSLWSMMTGKGSELDGEQLRSWSRMIQIWASIIISLTNYWYVYIHISGNVNFHGDWILIEKARWIKFISSLNSISLLSSIFIKRFRHLSWWKRSLIDLLNLSVILFDTCVDGWSSSSAETLLSEKISLSDSPSLEKRRRGRLKGPGEGRRYTTESPVAIGTRPTRAHPLHLVLRRLISGLEFPFPPPSL